MTLHYRKLLIASIALPFVVMGVLAVCLPSLMQARSSAAFAQLRQQTRSVEQVIEELAALNTQRELEEPLSRARELVQLQYDGMVGLRDSLLNESTPKTSGAGVVAALSGVMGIIGTLSSILLSWRADMRQVRAELARVPGRGDTGRSAVETTAA
jgi:uncharacterized protein YhaN